MATLIVLPTGLAKIVYPDWRLHRGSRPGLRTVSRKTLATPLVFVQETQENSYNFYF